MDTKCERCGRSVSPDQMESRYDATVAELGACGLLTEHVRNVASAMEAWKCTRCGRWICNDCILPFVISSRARKMRHKTSGGIFLAPDAPNWIGLLGSAPWPQGPGGLGSASRRLEGKHMGWFKRRKPVGSRCDCCNAVLDPINGYCLPTKSIVLSERYWIHALTHLKTQMDAFNMNEAERLDLFRDYVERMAAQPTAWSICENCSEFFLIDRHKARTYAASGKAPPGSGKVDPSSCIQYAAQGFEQVFGFWPQVTDQPSVADTCAFCRKKIYADEICSYITKEVLARHHASGVIDHDPIRPPQPHDGEMTWSICTPCVARMVARDDRARPAEA